MQCAENLEELRNAYWDYPPKLILEMSFCAGEEKQPDLVKNT